MSLFGMFKDSLTVAIQSAVNAIKAKTDNLPTSPANEATLTTIDGLVDSIKAKTDNLPATPASSTEIGTVFHIVKTFTHNQITLTPIDLTGVSSGLLECLYGLVQNGGAAFTSDSNGAHLLVRNNNVKGSLIAGVFNEEDLLADKILIFTSGQFSALGVLEAGKKYTIAATTEAFTSTGAFDVYLIFRRLSAGATIAAAA